MKVRCYEDRSEDCEKKRKITGQRFRTGNVYLLIFTDGSANEECSDIGAAFVVRNIKDGQIKELRPFDYIRKYMLLFSSRNTELKSDLE